jgi:segregation and condensation protein A
MEIKSRMLLPQSDLPPEEAEEDPRLELVRQLIEYKRFKEAARDLAAQAAERARRFARAGESWEEAAQERPLDKEVSLWDLIKAFGEVLRQTSFQTTTRVVYDETPIEVYMEEIAHRLRTVESVSFYEFFRERLDKARIIGIFLALLELIKQRKIRAEQSEAFGDIRIRLRTDEPEPAPDHAPPAETAEKTVAPPAPVRPQLSAAEEGDQDEEDDDLADLDLGDAEDDLEREQEKG